MVVSVGQTEVRNSSNLTAKVAADCLRFPKGSTEELQNLDPLYFFHIRGKVKSGGDVPDVLDDADQAFLMNHIRNGTRGTYGTG